MKTGRLKHRQGFTLVELVVVLAIMALLATAAMPLFSGYTQQAKDTVAISETSAVVRAAQIKAVELTAQDKLSSFTASYEQIMANVGLPGSIVSAKVNDFGTVTNLEYTAANGLLVRYDAAGKPKLTVVKASNGENGGPTPTANPTFTQFESWVKDGNDLVTKLVTEGKLSSLDRKDQIAAFAKDQPNGLLPQVNPVYMEGSSYNGQTLYWRPYYIGSASSPLSILYADTGSTGHGTWNAKLLYVNGKIYRASNYNSKSIAGFSNNKTYRSYEDVLTWLSDNQYTEIPFAD